MKILIDTSCLTTGGGQKVGWNFVQNILQYPRKEYEFYFFCAKNSTIHQLLLQYGNHNLIVIPAELPKRILWQIFIAPELLRTISPDIIYHIFGYPVYSKSYCQVIGEACSNLFYPEIDFWNGISSIKKLIKKVKDQLRIFMLKRADGVIFENESMLKRGISLFELNPARVRYIKPSISKGTDKLTCIKKRKTFSVLMLCSWQHNKNYMIIPDVLKILKEEKIDVQLNFSVSADEPCSEAVHFREKVEKMGVLEQINFLGVVQPEKLSEVYSENDVVLLLSKLESFSNNIIEAWDFGVPLLISDMEWSHALAKQAAYYVDRDDPEKIAKAIKKLLFNNELRNHLIHEGKKCLSLFPDISEHVNLVIAFLSEIFLLEKGKDS